MDYYQNLQMKCSEDAAMLRKFVEKDNFKGLNPGQSDGNDNGKSNFSKNMDNVWCTYCKKLKHKKETSDANNYREEQSKYNTKLGELNEGNIKKLKKNWFPFSHAFSALGISLSSSWIIDSRVIDHMTHSLEKFSTYIPCPSNKKITITDGSLVTIVGPSFREDDWAC
ncbi:hypothetical protein AAG906_010131 [Vitis piasezkii]